MKGGDRKIRVSGSFSFMICDFFFLLALICVHLRFEFVVDLKKQSQFIRSEFSVPRTAKSKLKKQSQFLKGRINVRACRDIDYDIFSGMQDTKKQSQSKPI
ncbi:MAG: hypothetical protein ACYSTT_03740 [Planctomycetota bacterium]|jgi:hypothetical protein